MAYVLVTVFSCMHILPDAFVSGHRPVKMYFSVNHSCLTTLITRKNTANPTEISAIVCIILIITIRALVAIEIGKINNSKYTLVQIALTTIRLTFKKLSSIQATVFSFVRRNMLFIYLGKSFI